MKNIRVLKFFCSHNNNHTMVCKVP